MTAIDLSLLYLPSAVLLGALHALEPGHAKTLTAAYLIGIKGTKRDAVLLGCAVAATHSVVVIGLSAAGLWVGRETFTQDAMFWLQLISGGIVVLLGSWMLWRRWPRAIRYEQAAAQAIPTHDHQHAHDHPHPHSHEHDHPHAHDHPHPHPHPQPHDHDHPHPNTHGGEAGKMVDHSLLSEDEHARAHAATMPEYVRRGERPTTAQILSFGAAGGMIPCPASVTVMLMAFAASKSGLGLVLVLGFSLGLALTLVGIGLAIVAGLSHLAGSGRFAWISGRAPIISAAMVIFSGLFALGVACFDGSH